MNQSKDERKTSKFNNSTSQTLAARVLREHIRKGGTIEIPSLGIKINREAEPKTDRQ